MRAEGGRGRRLRWCCVEGECGVGCGAWEAEASYFLSSVIRDGWFWGGGLAKLGGGGGGDGGIWKGFILEGSWLVELVLAGKGLVWFG